MAFEFIKQCIIGTMTLASLGFIVTASLISPNDGFGLFVGASWICLSLSFTGQLLYQTMLESSKNIVKILLTFLIKFPLLYGLGYWILIGNFFSVWSLCLGSSLLIVVLCLNGYKKGIALT